MEELFKIYYKENWASDKFFVEARIVSKTQLEEIKANKNIQLILVEVFRLYPDNQIDDY